MRRFYKPSLWIPQLFLFTNPNLHHGLLSTLPETCMTSTSNRGMRNFGRGRFGASPTRSLRHSRSWIPSRSSRPQPSWGNFLKLGFHNRSSPRGAVSTAPPFPNYQSLRQTGLRRRGKVVRTHVCDQTIADAEDRHHPDQLPTSARSSPPPDPPPPRSPPTTPAVRLPAAACIGFRQLLRSHALDAIQVR